MKNQNQSNEQLGESTNSASDIEKRVDEMMNLDREKPARSAPKITKNQPDQPDQPDIVLNSEIDTPAPIDIFSDLKTAPEITPELVKQMTVLVEDANPTDIPATNEQTVDTAGNQDLPEIEDPETDKVVEAILKEEGDNVLDAEDGKIKAPAVPKTATSAPVKHSLSLKSLLVMWWRNKWARYIAIAIVALLIAVAAILPSTRYGALNLVGIKATASLSVVDSATKLPLKNVEVTLNGSQVLTDKKGIAELQKVSLGKQELTIHKVAFGTAHQTVTIGLGNNTLQAINLTAVGNRYHFATTDYVTGKPIAVSEASSGQASAISDNAGQIILTLVPTADSINVTLNAPGYRAETVSIAAGSDVTTPVQLVSSRPDVFVSKASGNYDVYKADIDGKNRQVILAASGLETTNMSVIVHATDQVAAVVSTRDNLRNADGYLLDALNIVNMSTSKTLTLDHAERIQLVDWLGDNIVYVRIKAGTSAGSPDRYQLESYNYKNSQHYELAHANNFNDVISAQGSVYYAASNNYDGGGSYLGKIDADATNKQIVLNADIYNIFWPDYNNFNLSVGQDWYSYHIGSVQATKLSTVPPGVNASKVYIDSPNHHQSAWVDVRDGQGVLSIHDTITNKDTVIAQAVGLGYPVRWLDNTTLIYRVASPKETADYSVSANGGTPKKITDLTNVSGAGRWYYYQ
jgi:hypothetical protein